MGATATFDQDTLAVEPGGEATGQLTVRNTGDVVDEFTIEPLGDGADWIEAEPPTVRLFPGDDSRVTIRVRPPRSHRVEPGEVPMGLRVASAEDPEGSVVVEAAVDVGAFSEVTAELLPHTSKGRRGATHDVAVDNRGNERLNAEIAATDDEDALEFDIDPPGLVSEPGTANFAEVKVSPRERYWRGPPLSRMFRVMVQPDGAEPLQLDGTMVQEAIIPKWLPRALLALLALLLLLVVLWFALLKPTMESAAREAVEEPLAELASENAAQQDQVEQAAQQAAAAQDNAEQALEAVGETPTATPSPATPLQQESPFDDRLAASDEPGGGFGIDTFTVGEDQTLRVTDIVLENPGGHTGRVRVRRDDGILLQLALENFRSLDYHFVSPVVFETGDQLRFEVDCEEPAEGDEECDAAAYVAGVLLTESEPGEATEGAG